jgi:hypothetical protein
MDPTPGPDIHTAVRPTEGLWHTVASPDLALHVRGQRHARLGRDVSCPEPMMPITATTIPNLTSDVVTNGDGTLTLGYTARGPLNR